MTTATTTGPSADVYALLRELTSLLLAWSYEGTMEAEATVRRVALCYGVDVEVTVLADAAVLSVGDRTAAVARAPTVPPLDQVSDFKRLLAEIDDGRLTARQAGERLAALQRRPPRFSRPWQVIGLVLFSTGFGISVRATGQEIVASAALGAVADYPYVLTPGSHGLRGFESWLGGHPISGFRGLSDMLSFLTALAVGMLVAAAAVRAATASRDAADRA